jgi:putative hydrolase of the HAD superfamily
VFNSYHIKKSKRDKSVFRDVCSKLGFKPHEVLFIDDNLGNIQRAQEEGLKTIHFKTVEYFKYKIRNFIDQAP